MTANNLIKFRNEILDNKLRISDIVERAYVIAKHLDSPLEEPIRRELRGFNNASLWEFPAYRKFDAEIFLKVSNSCKSEFIATGLFSNQFNIEFLKCIISQRISIIESFYRSKKSLDIKLFPFQVLRLMDDKNLGKFNELDCPLIFDNLEDLYFCVCENQILNIFTQVRDSILDWVIELLKRDIKGDDLDFTNVEIDKAKELGQVHFNFSQIIGRDFSRDVFQSGQSGVLGSVNRVEGVSLNQEIANQENSILEK